MIVDVPSSIGLPALAALVLGESAGLPLPGETALIVTGGMAANGHFPLWSVIAVAAVAAIIGDTIGYWVGRRGGRKLLLREGRFSAHRRSAVAKADHYFERYGLVTVFFARFVPGVRVVGAVAAGAAEMPWRSFAIANALGCWAWAATVASVSYYVGPSGTIFLIVAGFSIAGIGMVAAWLNHRRGIDPLAPATTTAGHAEAEHPGGAYGVEPEPAEVAHPLQAIAAHALEHAPGRDAGAGGSSLATSAPASAPAKARSTQAAAANPAPRLSREAALAACAQRR